MNFPRIVSKASIQSAASSQIIKLPERRDEAKSFEGDIENLKITIDTLKASIEHKDIAFAKVVQDKERLTKEIQKLQQINKNLRQQLEAERKKALMTKVKSFLTNNKQCREFVLLFRPREHYTKEKEYFVEEITALKKVNSKLVATSTVASRSDRIAELEEEVEALKRKLANKDNAIVNIGAKYLRLQASKHSLKKRIEKMRIEHEKVCEEIISLLDSNRLELEKYLNTKFDENNTNANRLKLVELIKINGALQFENTQLKIRIAALESSLQDAKRVCKYKSSSRLLLRNRSRRESSARVSKSDGIVPDMKKEEATLLNLEKSLHTVSNNDAQNPRKNLRKICRLKVSTLFLNREFLHDATPRLSSDPG